MKFKTSAIVTCHNYGCFLPQCLDSLLNQTLPFHEIILVDDASEDDTCRIWQSRYRNSVRYERVNFCQEMEARNWGVRNCSGDFLVCVDADDWLAPRYHEAMIGPLRADSRVGLVHCGVGFVREKGSEWFGARDYRMIPFHSYQLWKWNFLHSTVLLRREAWCGEERPYGLRSVRQGTFAEDWDHSLEIIRRGWKAAVVNETLAFYRIHERNQSREIAKDLNTLGSRCWEIREKYLTHDLTVVVFIPEKNFALKRCLENLKMLSLPERTQIIFADGTASSPEDAYLRANSSDYLKIGVPQSRARGDWTASALERIRLHVSGREILFLEGGVCLFPDAYRKLSEGKRKARADFYSGRVVSKMRDSLVAWRAVQGNPDRGYYFVPATKMPRRVYATGLHALLTGARVFHELPLEPEYQADPAAVEFRIARWAWERGLRWFVDGSVLGRRLDSSGKCFRMGQALDDTRREIRADRDSAGISIVVLAAHSCPDIRKTLESFRALDYPKERLDISVVCVKPFEDFTSLRQMFPEARFFREEAVWSSRNRILHESRSGLMAFVEGGSVVGRAWLGEMLAPFSEDRRVGAVAGEYIRQTPGGNLTMGEKDDRRRSVSDVGGAYRGDVPNILYRREALIQAGGFEERESWLLDIDMTARLQRDHFWKVAILGRGGTVSLDSRKGLLSACRRSMRLGELDYEVFQRHPELTFRRYYWMPLTLAELALRFLKRFLPGGKGPEIFRDTSDCGDLRGPGAFLNSFLREWGYAKRMRKHIRKYLSGTAASDDRCVIFIGESYLEPANLFYRDLRDIAEAGIPVLHVNLSAGGFVSWCQAGLSVLRGTAVWSWHPRLFGMAFWRFAPSRAGFEKPNAFDFSVFNARIKKYLKFSPDPKILLAGEYPESVLNFWKEKLSPVASDIQIARCTSRDSFISRPPLKEVFREWNSGEGRVGQSSAIRESGILCETKDSPGS
ncbi:MAG TPA: glycosyltransferase family 2 protein [Candidatus Omnitrophota bacterium]|nr:glycosyltransferase family 2 protein [Candidatus Omnitrophota bacterium]